MFCSALDIVRNFLCCQACSVEGERYNHAASTILSVSCRNDYSQRSAELKSVFLATEVQPLRPPVQHTHGKSAAARSTGSLLIDRVAKSIGAEPVFFQGSSSDKRKGRKITRSHLWAKDLLAEQEPIVEDPEVVAQESLQEPVDNPR
jgi:hypothetical protein